MTSVPLLRAFWVHPILQYFRDRGTPIDLCAQPSASVECGAVADLPCPARFMFGVIDRVVEGVGGQCGCAIGREVGARSGIRSLGNFGRRIAHESTLDDAIRAAARMMPSSHSARTLELSCSGHRARLSSKLNDSSLAPAPWEDGLVASILIDLVRLAAGADWRPEVVSLQSERPRHRGCHGAFDGATIRYGENATTIEFPKLLLSQRLAPSPGQPQMVTDPTPLPEDVVGTVQVALEFLLRQGDADVDSLAAVIGTSRRSLQRHLLRQGQTYARMLDRARVDMARRLLDESSNKVIDIAFEVGYSDPSHFARAFRRWTGVAPTTYRRVGSLGAISS